MCFSTNFPFWLYFLNQQLLLTNTYTQYVSLQSYVQKNLFKTNIFSKKKNFEYSFSTKSLKKDECFHNQIGLRLMELMFEWLDLELCYVTWTDTKEKDTWSV